MGNGRHNGMLAGACAVLLALLGGCGGGEDPETARLRELGRKLEGGSTLDRRQAATELGKTGDPRAVQPLMKALDDDSPIVRTAAAEAMVALGEPARNALTTVLAGSDTDARAAAAKALGKLQGPGVAEAVRKVLADATAHPSVRAACAEAAADLEDEQAAAALVAALDAPDMRLRTAAATALTRLAPAAAADPLARKATGNAPRARTAARKVLLRLGDAAVKPLADVLRTGEPAPTARAASLLGEIGTPAAFDALAAALADAGADRSHAHGGMVAALIRIGGEKLSDALAPALSSPDDEARAAAATALAGKGDAPGAVEPLLTALETADNRRRIEIIEALGRTRDPNAAGPLLAELRKRWSDRDRPETHRELAALCEAAGHVGIEQARPVLIQAAAFHRGQTAARLVRVAAIEALGDVGGPGAIAALTEAAKDAQPLPRAAAMKALGRIRDRRSVPPLVAGVADLKQPVREAATEALAGMAHLAVAYLLDGFAGKTIAKREEIGRAMHSIGAPAVKPLLARLDTAETAEQRRHVVWALGKVGDAEALSVLVEQLQKGDVRMRRTALEALGEIGDARAAEAIAKALSDGNDFVRAEAVEALGAAAGADAVGKLVPMLEDDEADVRKTAAETLGQIGDARAAEPLTGLIARETAALKAFTHALKAAGKLTPEGRLAKGHELTEAEKRTLLGHRSVITAATAAMQKLKPTP